MARALLLNQFSPEDPAPTSAYLSDLKDLLEKQGIEVSAIAGSHSYRQRPGSSGSRLKRDLQTLLEILWNGLTTSRPDLVLSLSSPPGLLFVAWLIALRHRTPHAHWAMDLHPDLSLAFGENQAVGTVMKFLMKIAYRQTRVVATLDEDMAARLQKIYGISSLVIPPWPRAFPLPTDPGPLPRPLWLYSGNLGRVHEEIALLQIQTVLEKSNSPFSLRFQGNGAEHLESKITDMNLLQIELTPYAPNEKLLSSLYEARVLVASLRSEAQGMVFPSKISQMIGVPRPLLWIGPTNSAIARLLRSRPHTGIFNPSESEAAAKWIRQYETMPPTSDFKNLTDPAQAFKLGRQQWLEALLPLFQKPA